MKQNIMESEATSPQMDEGTTSLLPSSQPPFFDGQGGTDHPALSSLEKIAYDAILEIMNVENYRRNNVKS